LGTGERRAGSTRVTHGKEKTWKNGWGGSTFGGKREVRKGGNKEGERPSRVNNPETTWTIVKTCLRDENALVKTGGPKKGRSIDREHARGGGNPERSTVS